MFRTLQSLLRKFEIFQFIKLLLVLHAFPHESLHNSEKCCPYFLNKDILRLRKLKQHCHLKFEISKEDAVF